MVELDVETERRDCVTFVAATVRNVSDVPRRVRLRADCRPVWPPRRQGVPAAGWDEHGVTLTVPAGGTRGVGFASPAAPDEPAVTVAETAAVTGTAAAGADDRDGGCPDPTPAHVVRALGDPTPPADAVPVPDVGQQVAEGEEEARCGSR